MGHVCAICFSPHAATIPIVYAAGGRSYRELAEEFGFSQWQVKRHITRHSDAPRRDVRHLDSVRAQSAPAVAEAAAVAAVSRLTPVETYQAAFPGQEPMDHQVEYMLETRPTCVRKGRQVGMTQAAAALALHVARSKPGALAAIISPSLRQSSEVAMRARVGAWELGEKLAQDSVSLIRLANGSRILSLPGNARGIRGYACDLVILDEASWISEDAWAAARPLVSATGGRAIAQSTCGLPAGWFFELATDTPPGWASMVIRSDEVPTIDPDFLARERAEMAPALFAAEYMAEWDSNYLGVSLFDADRLRELVLPEPDPIWDRSKKDGSS